MRFVLALCGLVLVTAACGGSPAPPSPSPAPTLVPSSTPAPAVAASVYDNMAVGTTADGFPRLGAPEAPVTVTEYGSYDSNASRLAHEEIFVPLLPRVEAGEVRYVFVPLSGTGSAANGDTAAAAALCAGEQGAYWQYHARLFARLRDEGVDAFTGNALLDIADATGLNRNTWNACVLGESTQTVLDTAASTALDEQAYSGTPTILVNGNYMLNDYVSIDAVINQMIARVDDDTGTVGNLSTPVYDSTEDAPAVVELAPVTTQSLDSPINISLPEGWTVSISDTMVVRDIDALRTIPFTLYKGPVPGGTGYIAMFWGFPSLVAGNPLAATLEDAPTPQPNLLTDGLRLLRLAVVETGCNVGTDVQREYPIADGRAGVGTAWSAVDCPELPDTRGWFIGLQDQGINYLFYAYLDPIDPAGITPEEEQARALLREALASVRFRPLADLQPGE